MRIPMVNLQALLDAAAAGWRAHLDQMFARRQFILGEEVAAFEQELAHAFEAEFAVGVGSGTSAIEICLRASGVRGDVLTSALTSPFTAQAILAAGCRPRFADVDPDTLLMDVRDPGGAAAIVPVHLYGQPCNLAALAKFGLPLIQDACQAHGAQCDGKPFTAFSPYVAYSFYPTKNLGCLGDGGAILTDRSAIAIHCRLLRDGGRHNDQVARIPALNSRLDEMQACYLRAFLPSLAQWNRDRARIAAVYDEALKDCPGVRPLKRRAGSVNHLYVIRAQRRDELRARLAEHGIATAVHYPVPLHVQEPFRENRSFPEAEKACNEILSLPLWPLMPDSMPAEVSDRIRAFYISNRV